jgi:peptidoglycan hydrolase-like protein with peptidoglycan-binding domain
MGSKKGVVAYRLRPGATTTTIPSSTVPASASYASAAPSTSLRTLRRGASGGDVEALQRLLGISADGKFGPGTEAAVKAFQRSRGLVADGIVGPKTWAALTG